MLLLIAASLSSDHSILTRFIGPSDDAYTTLFYMARCDASDSTLIVPSVWVMPETGMAILLMIFMFLFGCIGHFALIFTLNRVTVSDLAPANYLTRVFAVLWGVYYFFNLGGLLFFQEVPSEATLVESTMIVGSGLYLSQRTRVVEQTRTQNRTLLTHRSVKNRFVFFLFYLY